MKVYGNMARVGAFVKHRGQQTAAKLGYAVVPHQARYRQEVLNRLGVTHLFDVGAARGEYVGVCRRYGYSGAAYSFEPLPDPFTALSRKAATDPDWHAVNLAMGAQRERIPINVAGNSDSSSVLDMLPRHDEAAPQAAFVSSLSIDVDTLDEWVLANNVAVKSSYLKVDTQGYEMQVLAGAPRLLRSVVALELELSLVPLYAGGPVIEEVVTWARSNGFVLASTAPAFVDHRTRTTLQLDGIFVRE